MTEVREEAARAVDRGSRAPSRSREQRRTPVDASDVHDDLAKLVGAPSAPRLAERLAEASRAFERERFQDARKLLRPLSERAPGSAPVRELHGLALYRLGRWRDAARELEAFRTLTGSVEQHPVLADCYRALGRWSEVEALWDELRAVSPSAELVSEGRIVAAGAMADRGELADAIALLERGLGPARRLKEHHVRTRYALADLYERAGDVPRARQLFDQVAAAAPGYADVDVRRRALG